MGAKKLDQYLKEFKGIYDDLVAIHKPINEDCKVINFARGPCIKYRASIMIGKAPYHKLISLSMLLDTLTWDKMMWKCHNRIITWPSLHKEVEEIVEEAIKTIIIEVNLTTTQADEVSDLLEKENIVKTIRIYRHQTKWRIRTQPSMSNM